MASATAINNESPQQLQRELQNSRFRCLTDLSERRRCHRRGHAREVHLVERVERFQPELQSHRLPDLEVLQHAQVGAVECGSVDETAASVAINAADFQPPATVLVASYAYENARLLLLSKSKAFPNGLSNNHGRVGKHHFGHWMSALTALFPFDVNIWYEPWRGGDRRIGRR